MARRWPKAKAPLKPKYKPGDIVKKSASGGIRLASKDGAALGESGGGIGTDLICYVIRPHNAEYFVQVIPHFDLQSNTGRMYKGSYGYVEARHVTQGGREKAMTAAKVYDGEKFYEDRLKEARSLASKSKSKSGGKGFVDR
jgi:hypothetical protein